MVPPADLVLENPTLRAGGVPVAWLPAFWLRSPRRLGLLPIKLAYRGDDGLLVGSGVHVPIGDAGQVDVRAAGYLKGGVDLETRVATAESESAVRWDHLGDSLLGVDLRGAVVPLPGASLAWSVDALRGNRALGGPVLLEEAALRQDRVRGAVGASDGRTSFAVVVRADTARGGALNAVGPVGPGLHLGVGAALGQVGTAAADADVVTLHDAAAGSTTLLEHHGEVRVDARAGALEIGVQARSRALLTVTEQGAGHTGALGLASDLSAPFVKRFGGRDAPIEHWVTPFLAGTVGAVHSEAPSVAPALAPNGVFAVVAPGMKTTVGELAGRRSALTVSLRCGVLAESGATPNGFVAAGALADERPFSFREESVLDVTMPNSSVHVLEARLGAVDGLFVSARLHESLGDLPLATRFAFSGSDGGWDAPWIPWFASAGATVGGRLGIPWTPWLTTLADSDYDASGRSLLGVRGSLAYLHPCRCLRVSIWGGERLGRQGFDSLLTVDLAP